MLKTGPSSVPPSRDEPVRRGGGATPGAHTGCAHRVRTPGAHTLRSTRSARVSGLSLQARRRPLDGGPDAMNGDRQGRRGRSARPLVGLARRAAVGLLLAVAAMFAMPVLPGGGGTAQAEVLVSNLHITSFLQERALHSTQSLAQEFTTGSNSVGYRLSSVTVRVRANPEKLNGVTAGIFEVSNPDAAFNIRRPSNTKVCTLTTPTSFSELLEEGSIYIYEGTFTAESTCALDPDTHYWFQLSSSETDTTDFRARATQATGQSGASGWSINNRGLYGGNSSSDILLIRVDGETVSALSCPAATGTEVWTGTLGVGSNTFGVSTDTGYLPFFSKGSLDDTDFTLDGTTYTISRVDHQTSPIVFNFTLSSLLADTAGLVLQIGQVQRLRFADASLSNSTRTYTWDMGAAPWSDGDSVCLRLERVANQPATGKPEITGTARVGETLTATTAGIMDGNGLDDADFTYLWKRVDADGVSNESNIGGANAATYKLTADDAGKKIKVGVTFNDDLGYAEGTFTSDAFPAGGTVQSVLQDGGDVTGTIVWQARMTAASFNIGTLNCTGYDSIGHGRLTPRDVRYQGHQLRVDTVCLRTSGPKSGQLEVHFRSTDRPNRDLLGSNESFWIGGDQKGPDDIGGNTSHSSFFIANSGFTVTSGQSYTLTITTTEPGAPTGVTAEPTSATSIRLRWSPPLEIGGSAVTGYQYRLRTGTTWGSWTAAGSVTEREQLVTGLTEGDTYGFQMRAVNSSGNGLWSEVVTAVPKGLPSVPRAVTLSATSTTSVRLSWTPPADEGASAITGYDYRFAAATDQGFRDWVEIPNSAELTSHEVTGLTAGLKHHFQLRARNDAGPGAATGFVVVTTPTEFHACSAASETGRIWTANMTVGTFTSGGTTRYGWDAGADISGDALTDTGFSYGGDEYVVGGITLQGTSLYLGFATTGDIGTKATRDALTLHVGTADGTGKPLNLGTDGTLQSSDFVNLRTGSPGLSWNAGALVCLAMTIEPPVVESIEFTSDPGADDTYAIGDEVDLQVTFDQPVDSEIGTVIGVMLDVGDDRVRADCFTGSNETTMSCVWEVTEGTATAEEQGIGIPQNPFVLTGGSSITATGTDVDAVLTYAGKAPGDSAGHMVDGVRPTVVSAAARGTTLTVTWSEKLDTGSVPQASSGSFLIAGPTPPTVDAVAIDAEDPKRMTLTLSAALDGNNEYTLVYLKRGDPVRDAAGTRPRGSPTNRSPSSPTTGRSRSPGRRSSRAAGRSRRRRRSPAAGRPRPT